MACALPWLKFLPLEHASVIISQESSVQHLNSLNQVNCWIVVLYLSLYCNNIAAD